MVVRHVARQFCLIPNEPKELRQVEKAVIDDMAVMLKRVVAFMHVNVQTLCRSQSNRSE